MSGMDNPPHPGATLREDVLPSLGLSVTEAAQQLGVTRAALSRVLNERAAISPSMALRIEGWLGLERGGRAGLDRRAGGIRSVAGPQGRGPEGASRSGGSGCVAGRFWHCWRSFRL